MKIFLLMAILNTYNCLTVSNTAILRSNVNIIEAYLKAKEKTMQENATKDDVENLLAFYADSLYYEHILSPEKKFIFKAKEDLRNGYMDHLGETRNVKITMINHIEKQNVVIAEYSIQREIISTGKTEKSSTVSFYELDESGKIKHVIDYL